MPAKEKDERFSVEISEVYDPDQEDRVIEKIKGYMKEKAEELKEYFTETDTIEVKKLSEANAKKLAAALEGVDVKVLVLSGKKSEKKAKETEKIRCPKCHALLEFLDWRCPECYYEFPEYEYEDESPTGDSSFEKAPTDKASSDQASRDESPGDDLSSGESSDDD
jgi:Zn finger protein HypA/HybF involved in hydrogenase expression